MEKVFIAICFLRISFGFGLARDIAIFDDWVAGWDGMGWNALNVLY
jgi:hypothetical protein